MYTGVTSDLVKRIYQHKNKLVDGFTKKHNIDRLGYYETYDDVDESIKREKQLKNWHRQWKVDLILKQNPNWNDLYEKII